MSYKYGFRAGGAFIKFLHSSFEVVEVKETENVRTDRLGDKIFSRFWSYEEQKLLLNVNLTNNNLQEKLGRSWISIDLKRGPLLAELMVWAGKRSENIFGKDRERIIEEFLKYKKSELEKERAEKQAKRENRAIEKLLEEI